MKKKKKPVGDVALNMYDKFKRKHSKDTKLLREVDNILDSHTNWYAIVFLNIMKEMYDAKPLKAIEKERGIK